MTLKAYKQSNDPLLESAPYYSIAIAFGDFSGFDIDSILPETRFRRNGYDMQMALIVKEYCWDNAIVPLALLFSLIRRADTNNLEALREVFPARVAELQKRYYAPGGRLKDDFTDPQPTLVSTKRILEILEPAVRRARGTNKDDAIALILDAAIEVITLCHKEE